MINEQGDISIASGFYTLEQVENMVKFIHKEAGLLSEQEQKIKSIESFRNDFSFYATNEERVSAINMKEGILQILKGE